MKFGETLPGLSAVSKCLEAQKKNLTEGAEREILISADPIFTHRYENAILKANGTLICKI